MLPSLATCFATTVLVSSSLTPIADIFVDGNAASCAAGVGTAGDPVCTINAGIALASSGDTIRIAPGTYVENVLLGIDLELIGTGGSAVTIVDGGALGSVVTIPAAVTVTLDGLTITNGRAEWGAGVHVRGDLTLRNSTVSGNTTSGTGAADQGGAGIGTGLFGTSGAIVIENSEVRDNNCVASSCPFAAGIQVWGGALSITDSRVTGNTVISTNDICVNGAGIAVTQGTLSLTRSTISGNHVAAGSINYGGGILTSYSNLIIDDSTISGNTGATMGGGIGVFGGVATIRNTTISSNVSTSRGGGAYISFPTSDSHFSNVTIAQNTSAASSGAYGTSFGSTISVQNSVIASNTNTSAQSSAEVTGGFVSLGNNLVGEGAAGFVDGVLGDQVGLSGSPLSPQLGPLQDNGGLTETHAPLAGSPLIDAGNAGSFEPFDQRGIARPLGLGPDIGAVEGIGITNSLCDGDGGDQLGCTDCPCGNNAALGTIGGCLNSAGTSARLGVTGDPSVSLPSMSIADLRFSLTGAPPLTFCILNSGDALAPTSMSSPCFGSQSGEQASSFDGLRCAVVNTRRHGGRSVDSNGEVGVTNNPWGGEASPFAGIATAGGGFASGQTRYFQVIYREDSVLGCATGLNTSQATETTFTP